MKDKNEGQGKVSLLDGNIGAMSRVVKTDASQKNTLIVGWNREAISLYDKIREYPALGYKVRGFISVHEIESAINYKNVPLLGSINNLTSWIHYHSVEEILIALEPKEQRSLKQIVSICQQAGVNYRIVTDIYHTVYGHVIRDIYHDIFPHREITIRRMIELPFAILLLIFFLPVFILVGIAIKLDSKGNIFYSQLRIGKDGKEFRIFKFRSMIQNAEKKTGPTWAQKNDSRITRMGAFMRKTRIDELPQIFNVIKGDMSFIGPRPERPFFVETFKQQIPLYTNRLRIKPGLTGWAQVKWRYDESIEDVKEKLKYDLYYVNNRSLALDLKILFHTIGTVLLKQGQ